jgi:hypothetical protein
MQVTATDEISHQQLYSFGIWVTLHLIGGIVHSLLSQRRLIGLGRWRRLSCGAAAGGQDGGGKHDHNSKQQLGIGRNVGSYLLSPIRNLHL